MKKSLFVAACALFFAGFLVLMFVWVAPMERKQALSKVDEEIALYQSLTAEEARQLALKKLNEQRRLYEK